VYVKDAIVALAGGKEIAVKETKPVLWITCRYFADDLMMSRKIIPGLFIAFRRVPLLIIQVAVS